MAKLDDVVVNISIDKFVVDVRTQVGDKSYVTSYTVNSEGRVVSYASNAVVKIKNPDQYSAWLRSSNGHTCYLRIQTVLENKAKELFAEIENTPTSSYEFAHVTAKRFFEWYASQSEDVRKQFNGDKCEIFDDSTNGSGSSRTCFPGHSQVYTDEILGDIDSRLNSLEKAMEDCQKCGVDPGCCGGSYGEVTFWTLDPDTGESVCNEYRWTPDGYSCSPVDTQEPVKAADYGVDKLKEVNREDLVDGGWYLLADDYGQFRTGYWREARRGFIRSRNSDVNPFFLSSVVEIYEVPEILKK